MRSVRAEQEFELQPDGMILDDAIAIIVVVLQTELGELARVPREIRRNSVTRGPLQVAAEDGLITRFLSRSDVISTQTNHPSFAEPVEDLGINPVVGHGFPRQHGG